MPTSSVTKLNPSALNNVLRGPQGDVARMLRGLGTRVVHTAESIADAELDVQTSQYHNGFRFDLMHGGRGVFLRVANNSKVAAFVEFGTRPHIIVPRKAMVLSWAGDAGQQVFARMVRHPGTRAYRVLERAVREEVRGRFVRSTSGPV